MSAQRYTTKVTTPVEAIQFSGDNFDEIRNWIGNEGDFYMIAEEDRTENPDATADLWVAANSSWLGITPSEWVIRDKHGFYPCKADVFAEKYEPAAVGAVREHEDRKAHQSE